MKLSNSRTSLYLFLHFGLLVSPVRFGRRHFLVYSGWITIDFNESAAKTYSYSTIKIKMNSRFAGDIISLLING